jgi:hypothetical protein
MRLAAQGSDARTAAGRRRALPPERPPLPEQLSSGEDGRDLLNWESGYSSLREWRGEYMWLARQERPRWAHAACTQ